MCLVSPLTVLSTWVTASSVYLFIPSKVHECCLWSHNVLWSRWAVFGLWAKAVRVRSWGMSSFSETGVYVCEVIHHRCWWGFHQSETGRDITRCKPTKAAWNALIVGSWSTNGWLIGRLRGTLNRGVSECTTAPPDENLADEAAPWSGSTLPTEWLSLRQERDAVAGRLSGQGRVSCFTQRNRNGSRKR